MPRKILTIAFLNRRRALRPAGTPSWRNQRAPSLSAEPRQQIEKRRRVGPPRDLLETLQQRANLHVVGDRSGPLLRRERDATPQRTGTSQAGQRSNERRDKQRSASSADDSELASYVAEGVEGKLQLVARMRGGHDGPDARLVARHRREADALGEDAARKQPIRQRHRQRASPTITGVMGLSLIPVLNPRSFKPALKKRVLSHRRSMSAGSSRSTSIAAIQAAATGGG